MSYIRNSGAGWERRAFQLLRIYISGSSNSTHPESFAAIFAQCCGVLLKLPIFVTDILRYFALDIWCLNPQTLLATHQLQDSLVIKLEKRINNLKIFYYCNFHINISREPVLERGDNASLYSFKRKKYTELCSALLSQFDCIFHYKPNKLWGCFLREWVARLLVPWS